MAAERSIEQAWRRRWLLATLAAAGSPALRAQGTAPSPAPGPAPAGRARGEPLVIHHIGPLTGTLANANREAVDGARLYFAVLNDRGGVGGRPLQLEQLDDQQDAKRTAQLFKEQIERRSILALFMARTTPSIEACIPLAEAAGVPMVAPQTGGSFITEPPKRHVFAVRASYRAEAEYAVEHQYRVGVRRFGIVQASDSFGKDTMVGVTRVMERLKLTPLAVEPVDNRNPDVSKAVATMLAQRPDAVLIIASNKAAADFVKAYKGGGGRATFITLSNTSNNDYVQALGPHARGAIVMQVMPTPFTGTTVVAREFSTAAQARQAPRSYAALQGWISARLLTEGLRRAGATPTAAALSAALDGINELDLGGFTLRFGGGRRASSSFIEATMITADGRFLR